MDIKCPILSCKIHDKSRNIGFYSIHVSEVEREEACRKIRIVSLSSLG